MHFRALIPIMITNVLLVGFAIGQDNFKIPKLTPARFGDQPKVVKPTFEPANRADIQTRPEINVNDLREESTASQPQPKTFPMPVQTQSGFDTQPQPPQPRNVNEQTLRPVAKQNPIELLDPNKIAPQIRQPSSKFLPPIERPARPSSSTQQSSATRESSPAQLRPTIVPSLPTADSQDSKITTPRISSSFSDTSDIRPVNFNAPKRQEPENPSQAATKPANMILERYDVSSNKHPLPGVPVSLKELMTSTPLKHRMTMVQQYWETYFDWATLQNRIAYSDWLNQIPNPRTRSEQMMLRTEKVMSQDDVLAAEIQLAKSQAKLQLIARSKTQELLPLPLNQPLVTRYNSHYQWYAERNLIPATLQGINEMLPRTYELIDKRATSAEQAKQTRNQAKQDFAAGQIALANVLQAGKTWRTSLQGFVGTVVNYNHAISDYALTISSPQKPIEQVVAMLVAKPKSINEVAKRNSVLVRQSQSIASSANTNPVLQSNPGLAQPAKPNPSNQSFNRLDRRARNQNRTARNNTQPPIDNGAPHFQNPRDPSKPAITQPAARGSQNASQVPTASRQNFQLPPVKPQTAPKQNLKTGNGGSNATNSNTNSFQTGGGGQFGG